MSESMAHTILVTRRSSDKTGYKFSIWLVVRRQRGRGQFTVQHSRKLISRLWFYQASKCPGTWLYRSCAGLGKAGPGLWGLAAPLNQDHLKTGITESWWGVTGSPGEAAFLLRAPWHSKTQSLRKAACDRCLLSSQHCGPGKEAY